MSVNKAILLGNLGKDPEVRTTQNGSEIGSFTLATSESWKDKQTGEKKTKSEWHNVTVFGSLVKVLAYLEKGSKIYLEGKITTEKYKDKDGVEKTATKIIAETIDIIKGKERDGTKPVSQHSQAKGNAFQPEGDNNLDEIPF